jgi:hypothetical protein
MSNIYVYNKEIKALPLNTFNTTNLLSQPSQVYHLKANIIEKTGKIGFVASRI